MMMMHLTDNTKILRTTVPNYLHGNSLVMMLNLNLNSNLNLSVDGLEKLGFLVCPYLNELTDGASTSIFAGNRFHSLIIEV